MSTCIFLCLCTLSVCSCQFTWLLMTDRRRRSRCARLRSWRPDLDGHHDLTIAHLSPRIATGLGVWYAWAADGCATQPETAIDLKLRDGLFDSVSLSTVQWIRTTRKKLSSSAVTVSWVQVMSTSLSGSFQNAGNSPWAGAHWWRSLMWAGFSIKTQKVKKILNLKRQLCVYDRNGVATSITGKVGHVLLSCASGWCILFDFLFLG